MLKRFFVPLLVAYMVSISSFAVAAGDTIVKLVTSEGEIGPFPVEKQQTHKALCSH